MSSRNLPFLPLFALGGLVVLTWWLSHFVEPLRQGIDGRGRHDPDLVVEKFSSQKLGPSGDVQYTLQAKRVRHYPDDDSSHLENVVFTSVGEGRPTLVARAPNGRLLNGREEAVLEGGVVVEVAATAKYPLTRLTTARLSILLDEKLVRSRDAVVVKNTQMHAVASGFDLNTESRRLELTRVKAEFERSRR